MREVAEVPKVLQENKDFLDVSLSTRLRDLIPQPEEMKPTAIMNAFLYLKKKIAFLVDDLCYCFLSDWKLGFCRRISFPNLWNSLEKKVLRSLFKMFFFRILTIKRTKHSMFYSWKLRLLWFLWNLFQNRYFKIRSIMLEFVNIIILIETSAKRKCSLKFRATTSH